MQWHIQGLPCVTLRRRMTPSYGEAMSFPLERVLYRAATPRPTLSVVCGRYQVVQPQQVLEFYRDL